MPYIYCESIIDQRTGRCRAFDCSEILRARTPLFTKKQALTVVAEFNANGFKALYDEARDAFVFATEPTHPATNSHAEYPKDYNTEWPDSDGDSDETLFTSGWNERDYQESARPGLYVIGGGNWVIWGPVDEDDEKELVANGPILDRLQGDALDELANRAMDSTFTPVAAAFPEIKTGDFSPHDAFQLLDAIKHAIRTWVLGNLPSPESAGASALICTVCEQRDDAASPNVATVLLHGTAACSECVEWHRGDPRNCESHTIERGFADCSTPPVG